MMDVRLPGKVAIVTGAASGIGRSAMTAFCAAGARVVAVDRNEAGLREAVAVLDPAGGAASACVVDLYDEDAPARIVEHTLAAYGRVDVLVNCAGIYPSTPAVRISPQDWDSVFDLNVKATFFCAQAVAREMIRTHTAGSIINISSGASYVGRPGVAHYCASKAAINMLTQVLAIEWAEYGIRVNAVAPGLIETQGVATALSTPMAQREHAEKIRLIPLGRSARPEEMAPAILFLATEGASFVTGTVLSADGGYGAGQTFRGVYEPAAPASDEGPRA